MAQTTPTSGPETRRLRKPALSQMAIFFFLVAAVALGNGLSDAVYGNYFKDAYNVNAVQRGFIEFPRELPGLLCAVVIALLSSLGDLRTGLIAQALSFAGLAVLAFFTPSFPVMLVFLFINSMGMHLFMPVQDAVCMSLAEPDRIGRRMGQYGSIKSALGFVAAVMVFIGFRTGLFSFRTPVKMTFVCGLAAFLLAIAAALVLLRKVRPPRGRRKAFRLVFRKQYRFYYLLTVLHGVQKQIAYVYGSWVIIDILAKGADTMALLIIAANFLCIFFMNFLGRWLDRFGIKRMLFVEALSFIVVYGVYGLVVWGLTAQILPAAGWPVLLLYALFVLDRLSMQMAVVKSVYLRSISLTDEDVTATLSTGTSMDHVVSIVAAMLGGLVWAAWGSQWVFFLAAFFSLGNLLVAFKVQPEKEKEAAREYRAHLATSGAGDGEAG